MVHTEKNSGKLTWDEENRLSGINDNGRFTANNVPRTLVLSQRQFIQRKARILHKA